MLQRVHNPTASEAATTALFEAICDGSLPPGSPLRLQELSDRLGLSMMPIREAIRSLAAMELVDVEPHRGARVRAMSVADLRDTYEARFVVEGPAVRLASRKFNAALADKAREALRGRAEHLRTGNLRAARDCHETFHFTLYEASGNPWLVRSILPLWRNAERYRLESMRHPELADQRAQEHEDILAAVEAGRGKAAEKLLIDHLKASMTLAHEALVSSGA